MKRAGVVVAALLVAFSGITGGSALATPQQGEVLTLGDSYEVGVPKVGLPSFADAATTCFQQPIQASAIVASGMGMTSKNVACSNATTTELITGRNGGVPQLNSLSDPNIKIVRVSIGGNDYHELDEYYTCIVVKQCFNGDKTLKQLLTTFPLLWNNQTHTGKLGDVYSIIKSRIQPGTKVLIEGYPVYFAPVSFGRIEVPLCWGINQTERNIANDGISGLNSAVKSAAAYYGFTYVDPFASSWFDKNLDLCSISGSKYIQTIGLPIPFHPTLSGVNTKAAHDLATLHQ
ncbi:MAG: family lipase [Candidatus Saccharibacteria bacterium]|nr:family lipase [Candidatus Saccharibacteria bacterium]